MLDIVAAIFIVVVVCWAIFVVVVAKLFILCYFSHRVFVTLTPLPI